MPATNESNTPALTIDQVLDAIRACLKENSANAYRIGSLYNYTVNNQLAEKKGYDSAQVFFSQHVQELSQATLSRYGAVAAQFTEETCRKYSVENLSTLLTYKNAADIEVSKEDPGATLVDVPQENGGVTQKPFAQCSREELRRAVKHKRKPARPPVPMTDAAHVEFMRSSLERHFTQIAGVRIHARNHRGKTLITLQDVPLAEMERLMEALMDSLQPQPVRAVG